MMGCVCEHVEVLIYRICEWLKKCLVLKAKKDHNIKEPEALIFNG